MESIWTKSTTIPAREALSGTVQTDVAVIGAGLCGILTAYMLNRRGIHTVVLEADRIGSGQTKNTTAKITSQHNLIYHKLIKNFGINMAGQYARANQQAISEYSRIIAEENIACEFKRCPAFLYSTEEKQRLADEEQAARHLGIDAELTGQSELPFPVAAALKFNDQAQFHPLLFLKALSEHLTIYEKTQVKSVFEHHIAADGGTVEARRIIFCTHYPFLNAPGFYFMRMHQERSYVLALKNTPELTGMYLGIDKEAYSFRNSQNILLFGGSGHRTGENSAGEKYEALRRKAKLLYPGCAEIAHWSAQDCMTLDDIPYIGQFSSSTPYWYVATGFGKWGMTSSMVSALILSDLITDRKSPDAEVFSPSRFSLAPAAKRLAEDSIQSVKGLSRSIFMPGREKIDALPNGHGGIVDLDGEKVGVYKNEAGEAFVVSPVCTHLGCQLEWNPDELSWDCPCHGSRFDYRGNLIDNPALENL